MTVRVVRVGGTQAVTTVRIGGATVTGAVLISGIGATALDGLTDVDGAAAADAGLVLIKAVDGVWRPGVTTTPGGVAGQLRITAAAGAVLSGHRVVTPLVDGSVDYASAAVSEHLHVPLWLTLTAAAEIGASVQVVLYGTVIEPSWSWTPGAPLYLSSAGVLTEALPTAPGALFLARVAVATSPTSIFVDPFPPIVLS